MLKVDNVSLSFGGVKAIQNVSFDIKKGEVRAIIGPERCRQDVDAQQHQRLLSSRRKAQLPIGPDARKQMRPYIAATQGIARTFQNVALFRGMSTLDNIMSGRTLKMKAGLFWQCCARARPRTRRCATAKFVEHIIDFLEIQDPANAGWSPALRPAKAR